MFAQNEVIGLLRSSEYKHCVQPGKQPGTVTTAKCSLLSDDFKMLHNGKCSPYADKTSTAMKDAVAALLKQVLSSFKAMRHQD